MIFAGLLCASVALAGCGQKAKDNPPTPAANPSAKAPVPDGQGAKATPSTTDSGAKATASDPVYDTPQAVFAAFTAARDKGDYKTYIATLTPESQKDLVEMFALDWVEERFRGAGKRSSKEAKQLEPIFALLEKHGLSEQAVNKIISTERDEEKGKAAIVAMIKDRTAFLEDILPAIDKLNSRKPGNPTLEALKIDGDKAKGYLVQKIGGREFKRPIGFVKIGGGWKVVASTPKREAPLEKDSRKPSSRSGDRKLPPRPIEWKAVHRFKAHNSQVTGVAFSKDGKTLATCGNDKMVKLWEVPTGKAIKDFAGHKEDVDAVVITPDGQIVASVCLRDSTVRIWDRKSGKEKFSLEMSPTRALAISPDGKTLATGSILATGVTLIDVARGVKVDQLNDDQTVWAVAYSPDGKTLASGGRGRDSTKITLWDSATKKPRGTIDPGKEETVAGLALAAEARTLFWGSGRDVVGWDVINKKQLFRKSYNSGPPALTPDGKYLAILQTETVSMVDAATGTEKARVERDVSRAGPGCVAFSSDGKWLAIGGNDGSVRLVDMSSLK
jgi:hypothetical protein